MTPPPPVGLQVWRVRLAPTQPLRRVVEVTDTYRSATLAHLPPGVDGAMFTGRTRGGASTGNHVHTHWLPVTPDGKTMTGVVAWCPGRWTAAQATALHQVTRLWGERVHTTVIPDPGPWQWPPPATRWATLTPYVPGRHTRDLAGDLAREAAFRGLPTPRLLAAAPTRGWVTRRPSRNLPRRPPAPVHVTVEFPTPVPGPVVLGRLAHFGLGLFWPAHGDGQPTALGWPSRQHPPVCRASPTLSRVGEP